MLLSGGALGVAIGATTFSQLWLNVWNQPFYDVRQRKDIGAFVDQLIFVGVIVNFLLWPNVAQGRFNQMIKPELRVWLVGDRSTAGNRCKPASRAHISSQPRLSHAN
jgi:ABC-type uncharacterized transport system fused permease/ATPase subunit